MLNLWEVKIYIVKLYLLIEHTVVVPNKFIIFNTSSRQGDGDTC